MFTKIPEQFTKTIKPFNSFLEINAKSVEQLINLQKTFVTDITNVINDQQYYTDQLQDKVSTSAKDAYEVATKSSEEVANLLTDSISEAVTSASSTIDSIK